MKGYFLFWFLFSGEYIFSQNLQTKTIYLDLNWKVVDDSTYANYSYQIISVNGKNTFPIENYGGKNDSLNIIPDSTRTNSTLLHGKYEWYGKSGKLYSDLLFEKGFPVLIHEYDKKGRLRQVFDFVSKDDSQPVSYTFKVYKKDGTLKHSHVFRLDENGDWPVTL